MRENIVSSSLSDWNKDVKSSQPPPASYPPTSEVDYVCMSKEEGKAVLFV